MVQIKSAEADTVYSECKSLDFVKPVTQILNNKHLSAQNPGPI